MAIALFLINAPFVAAQALRIVDRRLVHDRRRPLRHQRAPAR